MLAASLLLVLLIQTLLAHAWLSQAACSHCILLSPLASCVLVALPIRLVSAQYIECLEHT